MLRYLVDPIFQVINTAGKPATGGYIEVYLHGTGDKYYCASDFDGTLHPFKIPLDSLGSNIILAEDVNAYDIYVYNRYGSLLMSRHNVSVSSSGGGGGEAIRKGTIHKIGLWVVDAADPPPKPNEYWVLDLESPNENAPGGYDRLTVVKAREIHNSGAFFGLRTEHVMNPFEDNLLLETYYDYVSMSQTFEVKLSNISEYNEYVEYTLGAFDDYVGVNMYTTSTLLAQDGNGSNVTATFTEAATRTNIVTGSKLSVLFGYIAKWLSDLKALAFKDKADLTQDVSGVLPIANGGTNANTTSGARTNLDVYSKSEVDNALPQATSTTPSMDGTASVGSETRWAKGDHVHPTDTSREATANKTTTVRQNGQADNTKFPTEAAVRTAIDSAVSSAYHAAGTKTVAQLTSSLLVSANEGDVYNITDSGTTTSDFVDGAGHPIVAGDNVGVCDVGGGVYKFDLLSGFVDLSGYLAKTGDGSDVTATFTDASTRTNVSTGEKLSVLFGKIAKWFGDLKALAFKDNVTDSDISGTISDAHIASASDWDAKADTGRVVAIADATVSRYNYSGGLAWYKVAECNLKKTSYNANTSFDVYFSRGSWRSYGQLNVCVRNMVPLKIRLNELYMESTEPNFGFKLVTRGTNGESTVVAEIWAYCNENEGGVALIERNGLAGAYATDSKSIWTYTSYGTNDAGTEAPVEDPSSHVVVSDTDIIIRLSSKGGDGSNVTTTFTKASGDTSTITSGGKLSAIFTAISSFFSTIASHIANSSNPHNVTKTQIGLGNVDNTSDATKKSNFTGAVASGNTGFPTGGDVYSALSAKANDTDVVHKSGAETITGVKTYSNTVSSIQTYNNTTAQSRIFSITEVNIIKEYSTWTEEEKDGNHYRQWAIDITSAVTAASAGRFTVTMQGSYYSASSYGTLQKVITFRLLNNDVSYNKEDYMIAQSPCADEFVISGVVKIENNFYIIIANKVPANNNYPVSLRIDYIANASVVLNSVTCTGEIVLGWPYWAGDIDTPVKVTASGRTVLTRADVSDIDVVSTTIRKTLTSTDISNGYVEFTLDANTPFTSSSGFNSIVNSHLYMETIRIMTTADLGNYDAVGFLINHTDAASGGGSSASQYIAGATMSRCSSTSIITSSHASLCMPVVTRANLGSITIRVTFVRATMSAGVTLTIDYGATIVR